MRQVGLRRGFASALALVLSVSAGSCAGGGGGGGEAADFSSVQGALAPDKTTFWVVMKSTADLKAASGIKNRADRGKFVVDNLKAVAQQSQAGVIAHAKGKGLQHQSYWIVNTIRVTADDATAKALSLRPDVDRIVPDGVMKIPEPTPSAAGSTVSPTWGVAKIGADLVWSTFGMGEGIVIGSIDTGVDYTHPALAAQYRGNNGGGTFSHDYNWWDPANICVPAGVPCDNGNHGTHTMGTMLGGDGLGPFAEDIGVAPGARWIAAKGCETGSCSYSSLLSSGEFMLAPTPVAGGPGDPSKRPHIVSNSWGGGSGDTFFQPMVQRWVEAGIFPVFANGNGGPNCGTVSSPGDYPESFGVGATNSADGIASFSSRGPSSFGVLKPDVSAPGVDVRSSVPGGGYASYNGTSMATPHVAGVVALVWQAAPSLVGNVTATAELLRATAVNIGDTTCGGDASNNNIYGEGRIDALAAVEQAPRLAGTLAGTVTAQGGMAIAGATIRATPQGGYPRTTTSKSDGTYSIVLAVDSATEPKIYAVEATAFGYVTGTASVSIDKDVTFAQDFALAPAATRAVSGYVRDELGNALAGVRVEVVDTPVTPALTASDGHYQFDLPGGTYNLRTKDRCHDASTVVVTVGDLAVAQDITAQTHYDVFGYHCKVVPLAYEPLATSAGLSGDDAATAITLPFSFQFYGQGYGTAFPETNGVLNFQALNTAYANGAIPAAAAPNAAIYAFWDDLIVSAADPVRADVIGAAPNRVWRLEYRAATYYGDPASPAITFQVKLFEGNGVFEVHYFSMEGRGDGRSATIGIEDGAGAVALQYGLNEAVLQSGMALRFVPPATVRGKVTSVEPSGPALAGATVKALRAGTEVAQAITAADGTYQLRLVPGTYTLQASAANHETAEASALSVPDGGVVVLRDFTLAPAPYTKAIDAGGTNPYPTWGADQAYTVGGYGYTNTKSTTTFVTANIVGTTDDLLYQTVRNSPGEYRFDGLALGAYQVELRFVEPTATKAGVRVFDLYVEGQSAVAFDIFVAAGGKLKAYDRVFQLVQVSDTQLNVRLVARKGKGVPIVSAIRVTRL